MRWMLVALVGVVGGCRGAAAPASPPAPAARPIAVPIEEVLPDASTPAPERAVGAVPIPSDRPPDTTPLEEIDPTVAFDELPRLTARWQQNARLSHAGQVVIALHIASHEHLELAVVDTELISDQGYPGRRETFALGPGVGGDSPRGGNAYPPRDAYEYSEGAYVGPIRFAIRSRPRTGADLRQVVVYAVDRSLLVAERQLGAPAWTPRLRIDVPRATDLVAINPGWH